MFGSIAARYDLANHVLSCGFDFQWRRRAAEIVAKWQPDKLIDLATGTGDLALALQQKLPGTEVVGVDFSEEMLELAKTKGVQRTVFADAMKLPFTNGSFDCVTIAFGLRNLPDVAAALREMARVLSSNGHLLVLEFSLPEPAVLRALYRFYLHGCMPVIGSILTGKKNAYNYLGDSIEEFPRGNVMRGLMEAAGFRDTRAELLTGGIVTIYTGALL
jgi:demethylmenaquinone methyltransferase / 2-methoxy-6-polyprenyl-1,4-benzoquinol methylase